MADSSLKAIDEYPDISFIDNLTVSQLEEHMVNWFKQRKKELTGEEVTLASADDRRILLQAGAYFIYQGCMFSDDAGKMGLLKYSRGEYLENLGALKHINRKGAVGATVTFRFSIDAARGNATGIPKGTRLTAGDGIYYATDYYGEIKAGDTSADIRATCTTAGIRGNEYDAGEIAVIVDPVPYIDHAENIAKPENGADTEDDESLKQRIYASPASYSTAGTRDAYKYFIKEFNADITDVHIISPMPCVVEIRYLLKDGQVPGEESVGGLREYLERDVIKPLTDKIEVMAPEVKTYNLQMTYYINQSDRTRADSIQTAVNAAVTKYELWQRSVIGRDINPDVLLQMTMAAGAKRAVILEPVFMVIDDNSVASCGTKSVVYGGLEND